MHTLLSFIREAARKFRQKTDIAAAAGTPSRNQANKPLTAPLLLNCYNCGSPMRVRNPHAHRELKYAFLHPFLGETSKSAHAFVISCTVCKQRQILQFRY
jgi:hypothetical protein